MLKKFFIFFVTLSILNLYLNILKYDSFKIQKILLFDLSENKVSLNTDDLPQIIFPNLSVNSIPIKSLLSRYYLDNNYQIKLLRDGCKDNPYLALSFYLTSRAYIEKNEFYEGYNYIERAYNLSPKINSVSALYFALTNILKDSLNNQYK